MTGLLTRAELQAASLLADEYEKRARPVWVPDMFPEQAAYIACPDRWKALFTPRRSGKTYVFATELLVDAQRFPGRVQLYFALDQAHAIRILWRGVLRSMLIAQRIPHSFNEQAGLISFPNGSSIYLLGLDSSPQLLDKILGDKPHRVIVDECQSQRQDLAHFIEVKLWPALQDYLLSGGGWLELGGTPGDHLGTHFWYRVTATDPLGNPSPDRLAGWRVFSWPMSANPHVREQHERERARRIEAAEEKARRTGQALEDWQRDPSWRSQWLGQWVLESDARVYRFVDRPLSEGGNVLDDPELERSLLAGDAQWTYVAGLDLGFKDPSAIVVGAWRAGDPRFYIVRSLKRAGMGTHEIRDELAAIHQVTPLSSISVDQSNGPAAQIAKGLAEELGISTTPADKKEKSTHVAQMNADFAQQRIAVIAATNREYMREVLELTLDPKSETWAEARKHDNHLADGGLYAHRKSLHRYQSPAPPPAEPTMREKLVSQRRTMVEEFARRDAASSLGDWG